MLSRRVACRARSVGGKQSWLWRWRRREPLAATSYGCLATPTLPHCVPCHRKSSFLATNALCKRGNQRLDQYVLRAAYFDHTFLYCRQANFLSSSHKDLILICAHRITLCTTCLLVSLRFVSLAATFLNLDKGNCITMLLAECHDVSELIVLPLMCWISSHRKLDIVNCSSTCEQVEPVSVALARDAFSFASQLFVAWEFPVMFQLDERNSTGITTEL